MTIRTLESLISSLMQMPGNESVVIQDEQGAVYRVVTVAHAHHEHGPLDKGMGIIQVERIADNINQLTDPAVRARLN